jgi:hypothetical protein
MNYEWNKKKKSHITSEKMKINKLEIFNFAMVMK